MRYDTIVIGGGPAGLTAAIYLRRAGKSVAVIEKGSFGGQVNYSPKIENYPGFESISGNELADTMTGHAIAQGADVIPETVTGVRLEGALKTVVTEDGSEYSAPALIIATGAKHRLLGVPGESEYIGHGISFCAVCDGAFCEGQDVAVIGGGNSALQEALLLSDICRSVTIVQNLGFLTGEKQLAERLSACRNVSVIYGATVESFYGDSELRGLRIVTTSGTRELKAESVFIAVGLAPDNDIVKDIVQLDTNGCIVAAEDCITSVEGIYAAGDCRSKQIRQITTAVADGATAALAACRYMDML